VRNGFNMLAGVVEASLNFSELDDRFYHQMIDIRVE